MPSIRVYRSPVSEQSSNFWRGRRVLVTGASGFVGAAVVRAAVRYGATVHGTGMSRKAPHPAVHHRAEFPNDAQALIDRVEPDLVVHLAAPVMAGASEEHRESLRSGIVDASLAIAEVSGRRGIPLVHCGTCAEYGDAPAPYVESARAQPIDAYGALKLEATERLMGQPHVIVARLFRAIGPGDESSVVAQAARAALAGERFAMTTGEQVREWNHVDAIAESVLRAAACSQLRGSVVNIGGGPTASVVSVVQAVFAEAQADPTLIDIGARPQRQSEVPLLAGDHSRARSFWEPVVQPTLAETVRDAVAWTKQRVEDAA